MNRRRFLLNGSLVGLSLGISSPEFAFSNDKNSKELIKPMRLKIGDKVGIIAPGSAVTDPDDIYKANEIIEKLGLVASYAKNLFSGSGYKTRPTNERVDDFHSMFNDNEIKAVFCLRGGYGSMDLLDRIDYELLKKNPKIFLGYSDITALHLAMRKFTGLLTFHGPVLLSGFNDYTFSNLKNILFEDSNKFKLKNPSTKSRIRSSYPIRTIKGGKALGELTGGNLTLISVLEGTPYSIETMDKILILEDVGEEPYRIHRMLKQLKLSGKLENASAVAFGVCSGCNYSDYQGLPPWDHSLGEVLDDIFSDLDIPVFYGLLFGHTTHQLTMPLGLKVSLDADKGEIIFNSSATITN